MAYCLVRYVKQHSYIYYRIFQQFQSEAIEICLLFSFKSLMYCYNKINTLQNFHWKVGSKDFCVGF
jgi:hypothetical protein